MKKLKPIKTRLKPDFNNLKDKFWWAMCDSGCSLPNPLGASKIPKSFIYDRRYGVFEVDFACHPSVMQMFLAWDNGFYRPARLIDKYEHFGLKRFCPYSLADYWLENTRGTCYGSSISRRIICGRKGHLSSRELDYFFPVHYNT